MKSYSLLPSLWSGQVDSIAGAEDLRLGHRNGTRPHASRSIASTTVDVDESHVYRDFPYPTRNVVAYEIEAMRTQGAQGELKFTGLDSLGKLVAILKDGREEIALELLEPLVVHHANRIG